MPINYQHGKIYCIRSPNTDKIYIGSTVQMLSKRLSEHKHNTTKTFSSKIIIDYGDAYIELFENYPCENKEQLLKREGEIIRASKNCVNVCKNYGKDARKDHIKEYDRQRNKLEHRKQATKEWIEKNKEHIKEQTKEYREQNRERKREIDKQYREKNIEKINEQRRQKYKQRKEERKNNESQKN